MFSWRLGATSNDRIHHRQSANADDRNGDVRHEVARNE
jgi:hypothetical protein